MTDIPALLAPVKERADAATEGPWRWDPDFGDANDTGLALTNDAKAEIVGAYNFHCCSYRDDPTVKDMDAVFIAAARTDVTRLIQALEAVEGLATYLDKLADGDRHYAALFRRVVVDALAATERASGG